MALEALAAVLAGPCLLGGPLPEAPLPTPAARLPTPLATHGASEMLIALRSLSTVEVRARAGRRGAGQRGAGRQAPGPLALPL